MQTAPTIYPKLTNAVATLPADALDELEHFLAYLQYKYQAQTATVVALGGLWAEAGFDMDDEELRELRQKWSQQALVAY
jgi:hypothetical protein